MDRANSRALVAAVGILVSCQSLVAGFPADPSGREYYPTQSIKVPATTRQRTFSAADAQTNFTSFQGTENVQTQGERLTFVLTGPEATLGWGNYLGRQPTRQIQDMLSEKMDVVVRVRQSGAKSQWTLRFWTAGKRMKIEPTTATLTGTAWQELVLPQGKGWMVPNPDGMEFTIRGRKGDRVEIEYVKLSQLRFTGYCRKEFVLPEGKVWKAVADVGSKNRSVWFGGSVIRSELFINGQAVKRRGSTFYMHAKPVDIRPYLRPGRNCIAFAADRIGHPAFLFFQAQIVMESGETLRWQADKSWRASTTEQAGWNTVGFDDGAWDAALPGPAIAHATRDWATRAVPIPGYKGALEIVNPAGKSLFYKDDTDVRLDILTPAGRGGQAPILEYMAGPVDSDGRTPTAATTRVSAFERRNGSLVYHLDLGRLPHGVYTIALALVGADGTVLESRPREPFMVLRRLSQRVVPGNDYLAGLDMELEDAIDFTAGTDSHPWVETLAPSTSHAKPGQRVDTPRIVSQDGLTYREMTGRTRGSTFSYRFAFKHPGAFYLLEIDYPDNAARNIQVAINNKVEKSWSNSESGVGAETGRRFYKTNTMQTLRWIHVADEGVHSVDVMTGEDDLPAAAAAFRIHRINGDLPAVSVGTARQFGIHSERSFYTSGIGANFGVGSPFRSTKTWNGLREGHSMMDNFIMDLLWMLETGERYVQYLKFAGQNVHVMGCMQYSEYNTPAIEPDDTDTSRIPHCFRSVMATLFDTNDIDFYARLELAQFRDVGGLDNDAQVAKGADTVWMVDAEGRQFIARLETVTKNYLHPANRAAFRNLVESWRDKFAALPHFRGIHMLLGPSGHPMGYWPPAHANGQHYDEPFHYSYDDATFALLEDDFGFKLPIAADDPGRFRRRAELMRNRRFRERFVRWRCEKLRDFLGEAATILRAARPDLQVAAALAIEDPNFYKEWTRSGMPFKAFMRQFAFDLDLLSATEGVQTGRWTVNWQQPNYRLGIPSQDPYHRIPRADPEVIDTFQRDTGDFVFVRNSWDENLITAPGHAFGGKATLVESDWVMKYNRARTLPLPAHFHAREAVIQAIITGATDMVITGFTDLNINVGAEDVLRTIAEVYTKLPKQTFAPVLDTGMESNFVIRRLTQGDETWVSIANPGYWQLTGRLELQTTGTITWLADGSTADTAPKGDSKVLPITLAPYGLVGIHIDTSDLRIPTYETDAISPAELEHMTKIVSLADRLIRDPQVGLLLSAADKAFMRALCDKTAAALAERAYARAWANLNDWRFRILYENFLVKAAKDLAALPSSVEAAPSQRAANGLLVLSVTPCVEPPTLDGKLDEAAWRALPFSSGFKTLDDAPALAETAVRAMVDRQYLYFGFVCADRNVAELKATATGEREVFSSKDDVLDIFLQPDETRAVYYQMAFNPAGILFDQKVTGGERDYDFHPDWRVAIHKGDGYWSAEVAIPFAGLGLAGKDKGSWRANAHRLFRDGALETTHWSNPRGGLHTPNRFGTIAFPE